MIAGHVDETFRAHQTFAKRLDHGKQPVGEERHIITNCHRAELTAVAMSGVLLGGTMAVVARRRRRRGSGREPSNRPAFE